MSHTKETGNREKKVYSKPQVSQYGTVLKLTAGSGPKANDAIPLSSA